MNCYIIIVDEIGLKAKISANHLDFDCDIGLIVRVHVKECDVGVYWDFDIWVVGYLH